MTDHEKIKQKLEAFVDNELGEQERKTVEKHLAQCPVCQKEVKVLKELHQLTKTIAPKPGPDYVETLTGHVWRKIRQRDLERQRTKTRIFALPRLAPVLAGAAIVLLIAIVGMKFLTTVPGTKKSKDLLKTPTLAERPAIPEAKAKVPREKVESEKTEPLVTKREKMAVRGRGEARQKMAKKGLTQTEEEVTEKGQAAVDEPEVSVTAERPIYVEKEKAIRTLAAAAPKESAKVEEESIANLIVTDLDKRAKPGVEPKVARYFVVGGEPEPIEIAKPKYPESAQEKKLEGEVVIKAVVGTDGQVEYAEILKSSGYGILDTAALKAAQESKFKPLIQTGKKIRAWTTITFRFPFPEK